MAFTAAVLMMCLSLPAPLALISVDKLVTVITVDAFLVMNNVLSSAPVCTT